MKRISGVSKLKTTIMTFFTLIIIFAGYGVNRVNAQADKPMTIAYFGTVGVAVGQTARLNIANAHTENPVYPPDPINEMRILDKAGNILMRDRVNLVSGQTATLQINNIYRNRLDMRAVVIIKHPKMERFSPKLIIPSLEIVNNDTGISSMFIHPASIVGFNPQQEPPAR